MQGSRFQPDDLCMRFRSNKATGTQTLQAIFISLLLRVGSIILIYFPEALIGSEMAGLGKMWQADGKSCQTIFG